jgi:hypothetical protein
MHERYPVETILSLPIAHTETVGGSSAEDTQRKSECTHADFGLNAEVAGHSSGAEGVS